MNRNQLNAEIDLQLKERGSFRMNVVRWHKYCLDQMLQFYVTKDGNPAINRFVYHVVGVESAGSSRCFDGNCNKSFETREKFVDALIRYIRLESKRIAVRS